MPIVQTANFYRKQRHQILLAYTQEGIIHAQIFQGSTNADVFEDFMSRSERDSP
jgi:hypothetical protein